MNAHRRSFRPSKIEDPLERLQLPDLIQWASDHGASRQLRLFACWCARQTLSSSTNWLHAIELAESFTRGEVPAAALEEERKKLTGIAIAAGTTGHHVGALNSFTMLACFQTLRADAAEAALYSSQEYWMWCRIQEGPNNPSLMREKSRALRKTVNRRLARKLREMLRAAAAPRWGSPS